MKKEIDVKTATEKELRESDVPWPKTETELIEYIRALVTRPHDYGTCVYAMSMASLATFYYVSHVLGVTGFQASCADMDFLKRTRHYEHGFRITNYENLMYPQYLDEEHFPSFRKLIEENKEWLKEEAEKRLKDKNDAHPNVKKHWEYLASL